jgi:hypothetical protein
VDEVLRVEPIALLEVELRALPIDVGEVKSLDHFLQVHLLAIVLGTPAEQAEVVSYRLRCVPALDVTRHCRALVALAHLRAVLVQMRGMCPKIGRWAPKA